MLEERLRTIAVREAAANQSDGFLKAKKAELASVEKQLMRCGSNLGLAENEDQYKAMAETFEELRTKERNLQAVIRRQESENGKTIDPDEEIADAMNLANRLAELPECLDDYGVIADLFAKVNARLFLGFQKVQHGRRLLNRIRSGVLVFGSTAAPITVYDGPTGRRKLMDPVTQGAAGPKNSEPDPSQEAQGPSREGDSLGKVIRGERTRLELFLAGVQGLPATIRAMLCQAATG